MNYVCRIFHDKGKQVTLPGEITQSENRGDRWKDYKNPYLTPEEDQTTKKSKQ